MRLFFALWPHPETARALGEWARKVQQASSGRITRDETIHLTLAFLGEAQPGKAVAAARRVNARAFDFPLETARYWPHNRIVWAGPREMPPSLSELVRQLDSSLMEEGFPLDERPFAAHVTLLRKASKPQALPDLPILEWPVSEFVLVRSALSPEGSRYEVVERFPLQG
jgi:2'-5' RNA ligase